MFSAMSTAKKANSPAARPILPLALMPEGRKCLVVGAGKTGYRKVLSLLDAGADVTVVAPTAVAGLKDLFAEGKATWQQRVFDEPDLEGAFLAFAATDDPQTNSAVLAASRRRGVLCGIVDKGWQEGDLISPATLRRGDLTVAVSTGGRSCRRSRMIKNSLNRHIDSVSTADLLVLGTSHECLFLDRREPLHLNGKRMEQVGRMLTQVWGLHEFALLNTCNRVELLAVASDQPETELLLRQVLGFDHLRDDECYCLLGPAALCHTAILLAGLLSQTPGEHHIVAQVKDAVAAAEDAGWANSMTKEWLSSSLHIAKAIRRATQPLLRASEIEDLCLHYLAACDDDPLSGGLMVLGTGTIGRGVIERFLQRHPQAPILWGYHRNEPRIKAPWREHVQLLRMDSIREALKQVRAVICATAGDGYVLCAEDASRFDQSHAIHIVDLGVPRNVAPDLADGSGAARVADLDDLKHWYRREAADLTEIMGVARQVAEEHRDLYEKLVRGLRDRW
jgi:precorrin-2 dehydrogenase/sirohydrochlorin ferrochelatase